MVGKSIPSCQPANKAKLAGRLIKAKQVMHLQHVCGLQRQTKDGMVKGVIYFPCNVSVAIGCSVDSIPMTRR